MDGSAVQDARRLMRAGRARPHKRGHGSPGMSAMDGSAVQDARRLMRAGRARPAGAGGRSQDERGAGA